MAMNRRLFLGTAAGGMLALVGGGYALLGPRPAGSGLRSFSDAEARTLQAFADTLFPAAILGVSALDAGVVARLDTYVDGFYAREKHLTRLMLRLVDHRARLDGGGAFASLAEEPRTSLVQGWEKAGGVWALGMQATRALCAMAYFSHPRVQAAVGWGVGCDAGAALPGGAP